ncbi:MAG: sigma-70 family RNA polymerase sigma factor [Actinophytocola sp.]|uniref:sigma-70 family RNA polymerase sigma factor n=1 Tax=Actinophytocola sp. TaxID=1872138 RepID=UPI001324E481|nr:sigma-70 family RNA polymerase sigma factor [Actinophytocola sp.]MPZ79030.1 sigma-70 family RNA polymerase sigma factor [Actinophytocola sp.]
MEASGRAERDDGREPDLVRRYLDEIGAVPLLTAAQEVDLAKRIEAGVYAAELLRQADAGRRSLATGRQAELAAVAEDGRRAKDRMISANLRLVVAVVARHPRRVLPLPDAIQEGNLGLIRAVEKFDYAKGYKFSTYATWWIRQALGRGSAQSRMLRLPVHVMEELDKLERVDRELGGRLGREPNVEELAAATGIPAMRVAELRRVGRDTLSLDAPLDDRNGELRLADVVTDTETPGVEEVAERRALVTDVRAMVATLPAREALVITRRYGLDGDRPRTLREIGDEIGLGRERVRQLERGGLASLRESARSQVLLPWTA